MSVSLLAQPVLVLDLQTTNSSPRRGEVMEAAWCRLRAECGEAPPVESYLVRLPDRVAVPRRVTALTGISARMLRRGSEPRRLWLRLQELAELPLVVHYARFELAFLEQWQGRYGGRLPRRVICTHEISRRLFPGLPRRTLRAVAGAFGHHTRELKRAGDHAAATAAIWCSLVRLLQEQHGIDGLDLLERWLRDTPARRPARRSFFLQRDTRLELPDSPGVYRLLDCRRRVLYVGKATSLRRRVNSHFYSSRRVPERNQELLSRVHDLDVMACPTALEAALLENDVIKAEKPPYNVALKDDSGPVWFYAADLSSRRRRPDRRHLLGPVLGAEEVEGLRELSAARPRPGRALAVPARFGPPPEVFQAGLRAFRRRWLAGRSTLAASARLWAARLREARAATGEEQNDKPAAAWQWDEPAVERALGGVLLRAGAVLRRGRLLAWLSEAELAFASPRCPGARWLRLRRGRLVETAELGEPGACPVPPGWQRPLLERLQCFDPATCDRLRILVTELRRLVGAGRELRLVLGPHLALDGAALARWLRWL